MLRNLRNKWPPQPVDIQAEFIHISFKNPFGAISGQWLKSIEFPPRENNNGAAGEAIVDVVEQSHDDDRSLRRRQSVESHPLALQAEKSASSEEPSVCTIFSAYLQQAGSTGFGEEVSHTPLAGRDGRIQGWGSALKTRTPKAA